MHADRFGVPTGWTLTRLEPSLESAISLPIATVPIPIPTAAEALAAVEPSGDSSPGNDTGESDRSSPWFVPAVSVQAPGVDEPQETLSNPTEGSLLHRAFHGPERDEGPSIAASARSVDEGPAAASKRRRRARSSDDQAEEEARDLYQTSELPFPPHGLERPLESLAVS